MKALFYISSFILLVACTSTEKSDKAKLQVKTLNGTLEGILDTNYNVIKYLGIPYAKPPVGELRWKAPQPMANWEGVRDAKVFGNSAVQINVYGDMIYRSDTTSEDCLYLNIWTPSEQSDSLLPVLVYIHGGGFVAGCGSEPRYDGASMAKKGIIAVTLNYRLNIFGFFAHPELSAESDYGGSGNYGLLDQSIALKWVADNIVSFGGDPKRITIAGESAGSISVSSHMASTLSRNLIAGAIGESGAAINPTLPPVPLSEAEQVGVEFAAKAGYNNLEELRKLSMQELFSLYQESKRDGFPTTIDGYFYTKSLPETFIAGEQAQIPLLLGWNSAEIPGEAFMQGLPYSKMNFITKVKESYPDNFSEVLSLYAHETPEDVEQSATDLAADIFINYSTWKWFDLHRKNTDQPTYRYLFSRIRPSVGDNKPIGAPHASEIEYCMGNLHLVKAFNWTTEDMKVSEMMKNYFANFIIKGNPNGNQLPEWETDSVISDNPKIMVLDVDSKVIQTENDARYIFH
jgi:para-nitrobenzyl esterase